tara:strand:+ start:457 stop:567 length:111 start_codon:yes stop_codon:yes gene_type:complete
MSLVDNFGDKNGQKKSFLNLIKNIRIYIVDLTITLA